MQIDKSTFQDVVRVTESHAASSSSSSSADGRKSTELEVRYTKPMLRQRFVDVLRYFQSHHGVIESRSVDVTVRIDDVGDGGSDNSSSSSYRVTFPTLASVATLSRDEVTRLPMMQKRRGVPPADVSEYGLRFSVKTEEDVPERASGVRAMIADALDAEATEKTVREKQRFSAWGGTAAAAAGREILRYDLTSVRQAAGVRAVRASDLLTGRVLTARETYEAEIELVAEPSAVGSPADIAKAMLKAASVLLKVVEDVDHLIPESEKRAALEEYGHLVVSGGSDATTDATSSFTSSWPPPFVAPKPVTLTRENVVEPPLPGVPSVLRGYTVTEKADGERRMLFASARLGGKVYTINDRMEVTYTGLLARGPVPTLLDGEYLPSRKMTSVGEGGSGANASSSTTHQKGGRRRDDGTGGAVAPRGQNNKTTKKEVGATTLSSTEPASFLCFDVYFLGKKDVRRLPLLQLQQLQQQQPQRQQRQQRQQRRDVSISLDEGESTDNQNNLNNHRLDRVSVAEKFVHDGFVGGDTGPSPTLRVRVKRFLPVNSQRELFARAGTVFRERDAGLFPYGIDGLIFTPALDAVGQDENKQEKREKRPYMGGSWRRVFKWKPPEMNTIDFLVRFHDKDLVTGTGGGNTGAGASASASAVYRVVDLYVGRLVSSTASSTTATTTSMPSILDAMTGKGAAATATATSAAKEKHGGRKDQMTYAAVKFHPEGEPAVNVVHRAYLPVREEDGRVVLEQTGDEVTDGVVVEFSYDIASTSTSDVGFRWKALRVRHDKTQKYQASGGKAVTANAHNVAQQVWESIHDPVTERMLRGEEPKALRSDASSLEMQHQRAYYVRDKARGQRATLPMSDFHNAWVKERTLLAAFAGNVVSLFDVGSGEGGDIQKWRRMRGLQRVLGVDYDKHNLVNETNGAYARLRRPQPSAVSDPVIVFFPADAGKPLGSEQALNSLPDPRDRQLGRALWGKKAEDDDPRTTQTIPRELHGFATRPFDLVSCQFATHYFFGDTATLNTFAENVASVLRDGGYFAGTCLNGQAVDAMLGRQGGTASGMSDNGVLMWHLQKLYDGSLRNVPVAARTGFRIRVYMESIGHAVDEFLVDPQLLDAAMNRAGLVRPSQDALSVLGLPASGSGGFEDLYEEMRDYATHATGDSSSSAEDKRVLNALAMTDAHKRYSFLNMWFVYQKKN